MKLRIGLPIFWFSDLINRPEGFEESYPKQVLKAAEIGFQHIEFVLNTHYFLRNPSQLFTKECVQELMALKKEHNLTFSVHLPFWSVDPSSHIDRIRKATVEEMSYLIENTLDLEPTTYVLHATGEFAAEVNSMRLSPEQKNALINFFAKNSRHFVKLLVENLSQIGVPSKKIALESVKFPFKYSIELAKEFDTSLCIDVGHILAGYPGDVDLKEVFEISKHRVSEVHVHDVIKRMENGRLYVKDHSPIGSGTLNFHEVLDFLEEANFCGPLVLELKFEDAVNSLKIILG
jgi:sugar phosphate isomerase/epimerase